MVFKYPEFSHDDEVSSYNFHQAAPLEENLFEWHFTVRGPSDTDFEVCLLHNISLTIISTTVSLLDIPFHYFNHLHLTLYDRVVFTMAASSCPQITQWNLRTLSYLLQMAGRKLSDIKASFHFLNYLIWTMSGLKLAKRSVSLYLVITPKHGR